MKMIKRTITKNRVTPAIVSYEKGEVETEELESFEYVGSKVNMVNAIRMAQKIYGKDKQYIITKVETSYETYSMTVEDFIAHAELIKEDK